ncbi:MAG: hypothetical protein LH473_08860 [Chitinophagales bacterium]|nr:hypothetical protein [Chitinophagales bacterium]
MSVRNSSSEFTITCVVILVLLFISKTSYSQEKFLPGTIVLNSGDTLTGFLKPMSGRMAPRFIQYSAVMSGGNSTSFSPAQVKWFRYKGGEWYFGFVGSIESSSLNENVLSSDSSMHTILDSLFVRAVMLSTASLFYARDRNDRLHLFIQKGKGEIFELAYKKYYINEIVIADYRNQITKRAIMGNEMYKGQLMTAFYECRYLSSSILSRSIAYAKNDLMKLFEEYNNCRSQKIIYREAADKGKVNFTLAGGINLIYTSIYSSQNIAWQHIEFEPAISYQLCAGINWTFPRMDEKWSLYNEVALRYYSLNGNRTGTFHATITAEAIYVKIASMMRYQIPSEKIKPYIGFGMTNSFVLNFAGNETPKPTQVSIIDSYRNYEQGIVLGCGFNWNHFNTEIRIEKSNGWSDYSDLSTKFTSLYFQIGYTF